ncbi:1-deoxy-D-xylulose-5-phosphate synthase [Suilimivivens aceti]|uniref:1-deoxy-D-xylulose-5-phosphate synthase n=1 Tax=Suilimivivens aceti TaxID=2981774 RepID=A0ABT2T146_9FIRM|nr:1-deoxy-D-xylulose-5-phosphate synthase [Suilimivivens aceti]MCU6743986.1 1-deoxy-D-xylulose-5-phosphate synthase [Suilimivivens aceti]SCH50313.1 1-deoxy-D-xylulose-5-phosphate synthase [uncultured Clostridium sp.]
MLLDRINAVNDIKKIDPEDYPALAEEIRQFLIGHISKTGGHLGSNLGTVELTMALHLSFQLPEDKIIWDVGHQSYTHKLLTGRKDQFDNLRKFGGMSGFPKRKESNCDSFDTGHSSTSISAGLGLVKARDIQGQKNSVISVIGDGSLTGGMAYEALNNAAKLETNFIIVLNDNNMSISENVGGISKYLNNIRTANAYLDIKEGVYNTLKDIPRGDRIVEGIRKAKSGFKQLVVPGMFFEDMGITYLGPVDGHNIPAMLRMFQEAKRVRNTVIVHVITQKGKGFEPAERHPARFHGAEPFDTETGIPLNPRTTANYTDIFSTVMCKLGARNEKVVAITAAMPDGTGLRRFRNMYPDRFFDVGIAEEHAVTFAAGLAVGGLKPVVAIYSSFLQRAYDQIIHDVCIQNLPVVFAVDRAGIVGSDGETHQGIFDLSYLSSIPNMHVMAPKNKWELSDMMKYALSLNAPVAIRYPRGEAYAGLKEFRAPIESFHAEAIYLEKDVCLLAVGSMVKTAEEVRRLIREAGYGCSLINARFVKPIDEKAVEYAKKHHGITAAMEENVASGGYGERVREYFDTLPGEGELLNFAIPDEYVEHGNVDLLKKEIGIDAESIAGAILARLKERE